MAKDNDKETRASDDSAQDADNEKSRQSLGRMIGYTAPVMVAALVGKPGVALAS